MSSAAPVTPSRSQPLLTATLASSVPLASNARLLTLAVQNTPHLEFLPGQSIRIHQPWKERTVELAYSIASAPGDGNRIQLCIKPGAAGSPSDFLCQTREGDDLQISPPEGNFVLRHPAKHCLFMAAGTGITPLRSMIHWLLRQQDPGELWLIFGARDMHSLFFHEEFSQLATRHASFHYIPVLSRSQSWAGAQGYVQHHLDRIAVRDVPAYLCGPATMVTNVCKALENRGWPAHMIYYEQNSY